MPNPIGRLLRGRRAGEQTLAWARPELQAPEAFLLTSPAFAHRGSMPERYKGRLRGRNVSPALAWTAPPAGTGELLLIVDDADSPRATASVHLLTAGIDPALGGLPEDALGHPSPIRGLRQGRGALGHRGWFGPMPPGSHGPHAYVFQLFALDAPLAVPDTFGLADAIEAAAGHVLARARLDGMYENP